MKIHVVSCHDNDNDNDDDYPSSHIKTLAGGSVANTIRGLSNGFGISSGIIGACGDDEKEVFIELIIEKKREKWNRLFKSEDQMF